MAFKRCTLLLLLFLFNVSCFAADVQEPSDIYQDDTWILSKGHNSCLIGGRVTEGQHLFLIWIEGNFAQRLELEWPPPNTLKPGRFTSVAFDFGPKFRTTLSFSLLPTKFPMIVAHASDEELSALLRALEDSAVQEMRITFPAGDSWHIRAPVDGSSLVAKFSDCRSGAGFGTAAPAQMSAKQLQSVLCANTGEPDRAIGACSALISRLAKTGEEIGLAYYNRCAAYLAKDNSNAALTDCTRAINLDSNISTAFFLRCAIYDSRHDYRRAIADCNEAIRLAPEFALNFLARASVRRHMGETDGVLADLTEALRLDPLNVDALYRRATLLASLGQTDRALMDFDELIRIQPAYWTAYNDRCWWRAVAGKLEEALEDCNEVLRRQPGNADALDSRGFVFLKLRRLGEALIDYNASLGRKPDSASALYGRGLTRAQKGERQAADDDFAAAKRLDPEIESKFRAWGIASP